MSGIENTFTRPVIEDDDRDPDVSWANHRARGSAGGVDLAYSCGTDVLANAAGRFLYIPGNGSGGNIGVLYLDEHPELSRIEYMHLSARIAPDGRVSLRQRIARSGNTGTPADGSAGYACHLHAHAYDHHGNRVNLFHYFTAATAAGGDSSTIEKDEDNMAEMYLKAPNGTVVHLLPGVKTNFDSVAEYNDWRSLVSTYQANTAGARNVLPPELANVVGVTWGGYAAACKQFGVPES